MCIVLVDGCTAIGFSFRTVPSLSGDSAADTATLAEATRKDCLPLQYGLSKVMCDLFCIEDSVRQGTYSVLNSLQNSHTALMTNIRALLDYQTQSILYALGNPQKPLAGAQSEAQTEILSLPALLQELDRFPETDSDGQILDREILDWHRETSQELMKRLTMMASNSSNSHSALGVDRDYWPYRVKAMKAMLQHYQQSLSDRVKPSSTSSAQKQMQSKLRFLSSLARSAHLSP